MASILVAILLAIFVAIFLAIMSENTGEQRRIGRTRAVSLTLGCMQGS